jgi:hypothetical protein
MKITVILVLIMQVMFVETAFATTHNLFKNIPIPENSLLTFACHEMGPNKTIAKDGYSFIIQQNSLNAGQGPDLYKKGLYGIIEDLAFTLLRFKEPITTSNKTTEKAGNKDLQEEVSRLWTKHNKPEDSSNEIYAGSLEMSLGSLIFKYNGATKIKIVMLGVEHGFASYKKNHQPVNNIRV